LQSLLPFFQSRLSSLILLAQRSQFFLLVSEFLFGLNVFFFGHGGFVVELFLLDSIKDGFGCRDSFLLLLTHLLELFRIRMDILLQKFHLDCMFFHAGLPFATGIDETSVVVL
jgi:hypothetical protein